MKIEGTLGIQPIHDAGVGVETSALKLPPPLDLTALDLTDALSVLFALNMKSSSEHDRAAADKNDVTSVQKAAAHRDELEKLKEKIKNESGLGLFDSAFHVIAQLAEDVFAKGDLGKAFDDLGTNLDQMINSPQLWKDLEAVGLAVAQVVSTVVSGLSLGAASPLQAALTVATIALSAASFVESNFHVLEQMGVDPSVAAAVGIGMAVASLGVDVTGLLTASGKAATAAAATLDRAKDAGRVIDASGRIVAGAAGAPVAIFEHQAAMAEVGAQKARQRQKFLRQIIEQTTKELQTVQKESRKRDEGLIQGIRNHEETWLITAQAVRG